MGKGYQFFEFIPDKDKREPSKRFLLHIGGNQFRMGESFRLFYGTGTSADSLLEKLFHLKDPEQDESSEEEMIGILTPDEVKMLLGSIKKKSNIKNYGIRHDPSKDSIGLNILSIKYEEGDETKELIGLNPVKFIVDFLEILTLNNSGLRVIVSE